MAPSRKTKRRCSPADLALQSLPSDILYRIAQHLSLREKLHLARVCKLVYEVLSKPSSLWHDVRFSHADFQAYDPLTLSVQRVAFVQQRISSIRNVEIGPVRCKPTPILVSLLTTLSGATALRRLRTLTETDPETFVHCGLLHQLTALEIGPIINCHHRGQLDSCLLDPTRLQSLRLRFSVGKDNNREPCGFPPALLGLSALTHLSFGIERPYSVDAPRLRFSFLEPPTELFQRLQALQFLQIFNCKVTGLPADIRRLTGLQTLSILSATALPTPQLQLPAEISACTALTSLQLSCAAFPQSLWQLPLRELTLDQTCITADDLQNFSRLSALQSLRLCNGTVGPQQDESFVTVDDLVISRSVTCLRLDGNNMVELPVLPVLSQLVELDMKRNRLAGMFQLPLEMLIAVSKLDMLFNNDLSLGDEGDDVNDAEPIADMPALRILRLRKKDAATWKQPDMQTVIDIPSICRREGRPPIDMFCYHCEIGDRPEHFCELDQDTYFLDTVVNSFAL